MTGILTLCFSKCSKIAAKRGLCLQQVLACFDYQQVAAAVNQPADLFAICIFQSGICNMAERRQFCSGTDRTGNKSRLVVGRIAAGHTFRKFRRLEIYVVSFVGDAKFNSTTSLPPKLLVSITSQPTSKNAVCTVSIASGRV